MKWRDCAGADEQSDRVQTKPPCDKTPLVRLNPVQSKCRDTERQINSSQCILLTLGLRLTKSHEMDTTNS